MIIFIAGIMLLGIIVTLSIKSQLKPINKLKVFAEGDFSDREINNAESEKIPDEFKDETDRLIMQQMKLKKRSEESFYQQKIRQQKFQVK